ncbi:hypothetical protein MNU40_03525 [Staphylococcus epidermidis]|uniref:hypothetical protein n=1 Tax=Staphylococcus epidermidis TaxID=1282 RepID=UPI00188135DE|nr:hypothetical protein [Staphylococcus epidermidis]MBE9421056.1 hypothetical protein [Staphylococcus epidermidis]UTF57916.1 hypothetical protein MNU31_03790 [Staphylococcus epidermidis]UTF63769.1 hypothetical protein MNU40_03525 [Staphylococcus epidermidis]UTF71774.1 hypothetical protein MNU55_09370 [Staphylococcus epidermidis]UTF85738.1 hypothetical protein MNU32_09875 [Staphylococcus epidermidis]
MKKYNYDKTIENVNEIINDFLKQENKLVIKYEEQLESYKLCIKLIKLLEVLKENDEVTQLYCEEIVNELIILLTVLHNNNIELKLLYIRKASEWFMKWIYELEEQRNLNAGFKFLKQRIKQKQFYLDNKDVLDNLMKIFSETSSHLHTTIKEDSFKTNLINILYKKTNKQEWRTIRNHLKNVLAITLVFLKLNYPRFETSQIKRLNKLLTKTETSKVEK